MAKNDDKFDRCVEKVKAKMTDEEAEQEDAESSAYAICQESVNKGFSDDFFYVEHFWPVKD